MFKSIRINADSRVISAAHDRALSEGMTLHDAVNKLLTEYAGELPTEEEAAEIRKARAAKAMRTAREVRKTLNARGQKFTRDEMNER